MICLLFSRQNKEYSSFLILEKTYLKPKNSLGITGGGLNGVSFFQDSVLDYLRTAKKTF